MNHRDYGNLDFLKNKILPDGQVRLCGQKKPRERKLRSTAFSEDDRYGSNVSVRGG